MFFASTWRIWKIFPGTDVTVRINPGLGSGGTNRTNTGGPGSSFGIWHEQIPDVSNIARTYGLKIKRVHTHIGSGSDPEIWQKVAGMSLGIAERFLKLGHSVRTLNLGGGYKVGRMSHEKSTDLQVCGKPVQEAFRTFKRKTGVELKLEIEPGTFLVANQGCVVTQIIDLKKTPEYNFMIVNAGMTEVTRPALYGAQHPATVVPIDTDGRVVKPYIISGHECESGSIWTPAEGDPEALQPRNLREARKGDILVLGGAGAYCAAMSTKNYNSFLEAAEVLIDRVGESHLIRERQTLEQMTQNEIAI